MKPLVSIRIKLFLSFLLIILISYSGLLYITIKSIDASLEEKTASSHESGVHFPSAYSPGSPPISLFIEQLSSIRERNLENILLSAALGIFMSFGIAYLLARKLTFPLRELSLGVQRIEVGDLSRRADVAASDEFGKLAASFNKIIEKHHGRICHHSRMAGGNTFIYTVPVYEEIDEQRENSHS